MSADSKDQKKRKVVVVGAGLGGLTFAGVLHRLGMEVEVFEQTPELHPVGAGITLWSNAVRVMEWLGLQQQIAQEGFCLERAVLGTKEGEILVQAETKQLLEQHSLLNAYGIHRAQLHEILQDALPEGTVRLGARCQGFTETEEGIRVHFEGREDVQADLLVGADGIHSVIRAQLWGGSQPRYSGYTCWRGVADFSANRLTSVGEFVGQGQRFGLVPVAQERVYWFATENAPQGEQDESSEMQASVSKRFGGWKFLIPEVIAATAKDQIIRNDIVDYSPTSQWSRGRVSLLGDAIHSTTPNMGQGACQAIESAFVLGQCLHSFSDHVEAFRKYESMRQQRTASITNNSWRFGRVGQWQNPLACWLRKWLYKMMPASFRDKELLKVVGYDVVSDCSAQLAPQTSS